MRKSLLRNNCNGTFTDVTRESGLWKSVSQHADRRLGRHRQRRPARSVRRQRERSERAVSQQRRRHVRGHLAAARASTGPASRRRVVAADYDNDGYVDFYLSNYNGDNLLYHNNRNRTFTEVGEQAGVQAPWRSFAAWFFDYDNDGWPDLFVNSYYLSIDESRRGLVPRACRTTPRRSKLYRNLGNGTFRDVSAEVGLDQVLMPMAGNFGDVNNDGYLDMYLGHGQPVVRRPCLPHELLLNKGGKSFVSVTASSGTGELHKGHGIAFADLDRDGDEDIVARNRRRGAGRPPCAAAVRKPRQGNDWINLRLVGVKSNRAAIGARITVTVENARRRATGGARRDALDPSHRRQRRIVRGEPDGAARRAGAVGPHPDARDLVAGQQHAANLRQRHGEPVD